MNIWNVISALAAALAGFSILADRRRAGRTDIDRVGFMPWTAITVMSVLATVLSVALVIKSG